MHGDPVVEVACNQGTLPREREFFIDNLLVQIHFFFAMIKWTGLAPWEFEFPFPGGLTSTFLGTLPIFLVSTLYVTYNLVLRPTPDLY